MNAAHDPRERWASWMLLGMLGAALVVRLLLIGGEGHRDVTTISRWAETMVDVGPSGFYDAHRSVYPVLLYLYWPVGAAFDGDALYSAVKAASIPFDVGLGIVLYRATLLRASPIAALAAAALYLFNPAVLIEGPLWGQIDAAGTLAMLACLLSLAAGRFGLAGVFAALALLVKPQYGLVGIPVLIIGALEWWRGTMKPFLRAGVGALMTYVVVALPLALTPFVYFEQIAHFARRMPFTSLWAPSLWGVLFGYREPEGDLRPLGLMLLAMGLAASMLPLRRARDIATLLFVGALVVFAFYFLPTRTHERYLFPVLALLAPLAATAWSWLVPYVMVSAAFAVVLLFQLAHTTPQTLPAGLRDVVAMVPIPVQAAVLWTGVLWIVALIALDRHPWRRPASEPRGSPT